MKMKTMFLMTIQWLCLLRGRQCRLISQAMIKTRVHYHHTEVDPQLKFTQQEQNLKLKSSPFKTTSSRAKTSSIQNPNRTLMKPFRKLFKSHLKYRIPLEQMNNIYQCESFSQMLIILRVIVKVRVHRLEEENLKWKPMVQSSSKAHLAEATEGKTLKVLREIVHLRV